MAKPIPAKPRHKVKRYTTDPSRPLDGRETLLTVQETADYLGVTQRRIRDACAHREIPFVKIGKLVRFRKADLDNYITAQTIPAGR